MNKTASRQTALICGVSGQGWYDYMEIDPPLFCPLVLGLDVAIR